MKHPFYTLVVFGLHRCKYLLVACWLLAMTSGAKGATYTNLSLVITNSPNSNMVTSLTVRPNQLAKVVYARFYSGNLGRINVKVNGAKLAYDYAQIWGKNALNTLNVYGVDGPPMVAGPAEIELEVLAGSNTAGLFYCVIELTDTTPQFTPSTAVVIPTDSTGPVNVILESSADLVNWTAAMPGSYSASEQKRFFRVRAEKTP